MRKAIIFTLFTVLLVLVSCDGTVLRDVVDAKQTTGYTVVDYIKPDMVLTDKGVVKAGNSTILLKNKQIKNVSYIDSNNFLVLYADGTLKKGSLSSLSTFKTGVKVLTHSGFFCDSSKVYYGSLSTPTNGTFVNAYESNGYLLVRAGGNVTVYDKNLNIKYSRTITEPVYGYIHTTDTDYSTTTDYVICEGLIYLTSGTNLSISYSNPGATNVGFAYEYNGHMRICFQNGEYFNWYDPVSGTSGNCMSSINGVRVLEYCDSDKILVTQSNGLFEINIVNGTPVAVELVKEFD